MKRLAFVCLALFLAVQAFQEYVFAALSAAGDDAAAWRVTLDPLNRTRAFALLLSFFPLTVGYLVLCAQKLRTAPRRAIAALVFLLLFCCFEIAYRSIEFFVIDGLWTRALLESPDALVRSTMQERLEIFGDLVRGVYFPLMLSQLVGSLFLFSTTFPAARADMLLRLATGANALRLTARLASTYGGVTALEAFNDRLYFPCVFVVMTALLAYVARSDDGLGPEGSGRGDGNRRGDGDGSGDGPRNGGRSVDAGLRPTIA